MQPKAVLFDFDYTLGDCTDAIYACIGFALTTLGYGQPTLFAVRPTIGLTLPHTYAALTGDQCPEKAQEFAELFLQKADETMTKGAKLFPETLPLLRRLQEKGIKTGIVTTKLSFRIREILAKYAANDLVSVIVGESDVSHPKPHPEGILLALSSLDTFPQDAVYVGDTVVDAQAARDAGVAFIGVTTGSTPREAFFAYPHQAILEHLGQMPF